MKYHVLKNIYTKKYVYIYIGNFIVFIETKKNIKYVKEIDLIKYVFYEHQYIYIYGLMNRNKKWI